MSAIPHSFDQRLREVEVESATNSTKLTGHERECATRYAHIEAELKANKEGIRGITSRMDRIGYALIAGMGGILVKLVFFA